MNNYKIFLFAALAVIGISCDSAKNGSLTVNNEKMDELKRLRAATEFNVKNMNMSADPKHDFYDYANGGWMQKTEIPGDEGRWGSFNELRESNNQMTLALIDKALAKTDVDPTTDEGKVISFFKAAMDTEGRNAAGIKPIQGLLNQIDALKSGQEALDFMASHPGEVSGLLSMSAFSDMKNSDMNVLYIGTGSLGLPERSYYVDEDADSKEKKAKYLKHVERMLGFINYGDNAGKAAQNILDLETKMAASMLTKEERRNPTNTYNPKSIDELTQLTKIIDWKKYFALHNLGNMEKVIVSQPKYLTTINNLIQNTDVAVLKDYLKWNVINGATSVLTQEINDANFDFYGKALKDLKEQKPLKERVLRSTNGVLGEALGKVYVAEYFPAEAKESAVKMVENLRKAYKNRINKLDWMSATTKEQAIKKLMGDQCKNWIS